MQSDEDEIRALVARWMAATRAGDVDTVLSLMTDDVVFLVPGQAVMRKADFAAAARAQAAPSGPKLDGVSDIQELRVIGDWAFMWSKLTVVATLPGKGASKRAGHALTIFEKRHGKWLLARDANLLAPVTA
jgi:uncharacterized protein (TIGR02246 family)